jgi:membrane protease subunit HflK
MQQIYSNVTKVVVESRQGSSLLYLPLDKILQMGGAPVVNEAALSAGATVVPALPAAINNASDARTRDAARTRDRDVR